jgi:hypothetical protein
MNRLAGSFVVLVRWPEDASELPRLRELGSPRLIVVSPDHEPPEDNDPVSDWIRLPATDEDLQARVRVLERRASTWADTPVLTGDGRLSFHGRWIGLSATAERLLGVLVAKYGAVATLRDLQCAGWPNGEGKNDGLRVHVAKLRPPLRRLGLEIVVVRERGYVLQERLDDLVDPRAVRALHR